MPPQKDVILHVYKLAPAEDNQRRGFFASLLPSIGLGAYHTCLEFDGSCYTFVANVGVVRSSARRRDAQGVPPGATFQESIVLGDCPKGCIPPILSQLEKSFGPSSYHLVHRNCNHFTEALATAMFLKHGVTTLPKYPSWINRLAKTSHHVVGHDTDIVPCDPIHEARLAVGVQEKGSKDAKTFGASKKSSGEKKQLTEKQKAILAKIRGGDQQS